MYRATIDVTSPHDTFLDMSSWGKGNVFVNGFNIGRYFPAAGPAKTLYIPAPLLNAGTNENSFRRVLDTSPIGGESIFTQRIREGGGVALWMSGRRPIARLDFPLLPQRRQYGGSRAGTVGLEIN
ncbi:unnamed protein product, partial [Timema podura]|nr:unnamed protein product [Timema podura]